MTDIFYKKLGYILREYRTKINFSQEEMANRLNINQRTISNYENGIRKMPVDILKRYCEILGITLQEIIDQL